MVTATYHNEMWRQRRAGRRRSRSLLNRIAFGLLQSVKQLWQLGEVERDPPHLIAAAAMFVIKESGKLIRFADKQIRDDAEPLVRARGLGCSPDDPALSPRGCRQPLWSSW
jgi:hypothetical protein